MQLFWKIYFVVLLAVAVASWGYDAVNHPDLLLAQWPLHLIAVCVLGLNLLALYGLIRHRAFMGAIFWQILLVIQVGLYLLAASQIVGDLITDSRARETAARVPLFIPFLAVILLLPLPQFLALFRYSRIREIWARE